LNSVVVKSIDKALVRRKMDEYAAALLSRPDVEEVIVFGSFANDTYAPGSDLDIFVVLCEADRPVRDRMPMLLPATFPVGVDLFPYTRAEIEALDTSPVLQAVRQSRWRYRRTSGSTRNRAGTERL
jgi:uncharacterized protein